MIPDAAWGLGGAPHPETLFTAPVRCPEAPSAGGQLLLPTPTRLSRDSGVARGGPGEA